VSPLHILVLTDRDWSHPQGGGTGTNLHGQIEWWLAAGHRVTVIACGYPGGPAFEQSGDLTIHRVGNRVTVFPVAMFRQARGLVPDADVVLEVINGLTFLTPLWLRDPHVALVHHIHRPHYVEEMGHKGRLAAWILETLPLQRLYRGRRFLTVSESSRAGLVELGIPHERIAVNYNGVDSDRLRPGRRADAPLVLYLGRLKRYKRIEWLLDILDELPDAELHIAGQGDHREAVEAEIARRGHRNRVVLHGFVDENTKLELLQRAWVNVTASSVEGWCLTVMEAAACGTPSAAMAVGGLPEAILDERTGLLAGDRRELVTQAARVVRDPELRETLGARALIRAQTLTWRQTAERTLDVLERERRQVTPPAAVRRARFRRFERARAAVALPPGEAVLAASATTEEPS
jgi:glycosyltransferase involved in cell wall biosynthesis